MSDIERERYEAIAASGPVHRRRGCGRHSRTARQSKVRRAAMSVSPAALTLSELGVTVGRSDIEASGTLSNYIGYLLRDQTLRGRLDVRSSLLDLNELLGRHASAEGGAADEEPLRRIPVRAMRGRRRAAEPLLWHSVCGSLEKDDCFGDIGLDDVTGSLTVAKGAVAIEPAGDGRLRRPGRRLRAATRRPPIAAAAGR